MGIIQEKKAVSPQQPEKKEERVPDTISFNNDDVSLESDNVENEKEEARVVEEKNVEEPTSVVNGAPKKRGGRPRKQVSKKK